MKQKSPIQASSKVRKTALAFTVQIPDDKRQHIASNLKNCEVVHWGQGTFQDALNALRNTQTDQYILVHQSDTAKLNAWIQTSSGLTADIISAGADVSLSATELISGFSDANWNTPWLLLRGELWKNSDPGNFADQFKLFYALEKDGLTFENKAAEGIIPKRIPLMQSLKAKLSTCLWWYNPARMLRQGAGWQMGFVLLALILAFLMPLLSRNAAISGDEFTQYEYSKLTANYYQKMFGSEISVDTNALKGQKMKGLAAAAASEPLENLATLEDNDKYMHLYGSSFDTFTTLIIRWLGTENIYETRHLFNSLFGFLAVFFAALIIRRLTGSWKYGFIGMLALFFTPRLLGESFNNPKDIPFAAGYIIALYYMMRCFSGFKMRISHGIGLILGIGLAISVRVGGLLLLPITVMYAGLHYINHIGLNNFLKLRWTNLWTYVKPVLILLILGYTAGVLPWPYALQSPLEHPFKVLSEFSNYSTSLRQLYEGKLYDSDLLPAAYLARYLFITMPLFTLLGMLLFLVLQFMNVKSFKLDVFLMLFAAIFPILYIYIQKSNVYGGLRQILFTIPPLVVLGTYGFYLLEQRIRSFRFAGMAVPAAAGLLLVLPASFIARNHPLEYIYFNELNGGVKGAYGKYEMDYYLASLKPSSEWLINEVISKNPDKKYTILTYGMDHVRYYFRKYPNVHVGYTRYDDRSKADWDYSIFYNAHMDKERLLNGFYPPAGTAFSPMVDGKPMGVVLQRLSRADLEGMKAYKVRNYPQALEQLKASLKTDPNSCEVLTTIADCFLQMGQTDTAVNPTLMDSALVYANRSIAITPDYTPALNIAGMIQIQLNKLDEALQYFTTYEGIRPKDGASYYYQALIFARKNMLDMSLEKLNKGIIQTQMSPEFYSLGAQLYQARGEKEQAALYQQAVSDNAARFQILQALGVKLPEE
jgi:tetratricopeptide (TPR) repeat protein